MSRILATGSTRWKDYETISRGMAVAIETVISANPEDMTITLVHGNSKGADLLCDRFIKNARKFLMTKGYTVTIETFEPDTDTWGKAALYIRNQAMVDSGADVCVAFIHNDRPASSAVARLAQKAGIQTLTYTE